MEKLKILIIEDEPKVAAFLKKGLEENSYKTTTAYDGKNGLNYALSDNFNIVLLDLILPQINGLEVCRKIKMVKQNLPVLMLTAIGTTHDKVTGFDAGADDYMVKPFEFQELLARIKVLTKRMHGHNEKNNRIKINDLELDLDKKIAIRGSKTIYLTAKEFLLLEFFMRNKGRVLSRSEIAEKVWDITFDTGTNTVDVYVNILRKKLESGFEKKLIHTRIGMGYIFNEN